MIVDMPFGSYQESPTGLSKCGADYLETGCSGIKIEGGRNGGNRPISD